MIFRLVSRRNKFIQHIRSDSLSYKVKKKKISENFVKTIFNDSLSLQHTQQRYILICEAVAFNLFLRKDIFQNLKKALDISLRYVPKYDFHYKRPRQNNPHFKMTTEIWTDVCTSVYGKKKCCSLNLVWNLCNLTARLYFCTLFQSF